MCGGRWRSTAAHLPATCRPQLELVALATDVAAIAIGRSRVGAPGERGAFPQAVRPRAGAFGYIPWPTSKVGDLNRCFVETLGYDQGDIPTVEVFWERAVPDPEYRNWAREAWAGGDGAHARVVRFRAGTAAGEHGGVEADLIKAGIQARTTLPWRPY